MKQITWTDDDGRIRNSLVRDEDTIKEAQLGIPLDPPDVDLLDWEAIKTEIHNQLVRRGLWSWRELTKDSDLSSVVLSAVRPHLARLYRNDRYSTENDQEQITWQKTIA